ncbi:ABC transporter ATP-binding protein [Verrucomicrobia bacterium LW23]|nr:ABC transporter ATP-binding protein [Verrucomicrobia bacterium LW23]
MSCATPFSPASRQQQPGRVCLTTTHQPFSYFQCTMSDLSKFFKEFWRLAWPFWRGVDRKFAWIMIVILTVLAFADVGIDYWYNLWGGRFMRSLQQYNLPGFVSAMWEFAALAFLAIGLAVVTFYLQNWLQNRWRKWMFERYTGEWMKDNSYYYWHLTGKATDNPDQRLTEDIRDFTDKTLTLFFGFLGNLGKLIVFTQVLWEVSGPLNIGGKRYDIEFTAPFTGDQFTSPLVVDGFDIPAYMFWVCLLYATLGTWLGHVIGKALIPLFFNQQKYEADLRFGLARLRETSEQVALSRGEASEEKRLNGYFGFVYTNFYALTNRLKWMVLYRYSYNQVAIIFPYIVSAPRYFSKLIDLGDLRRISHSFDSVRVSMSWFLLSYSELANLRSIIIRLNGFLDVVEATKKMESGITISPSDTNAPLTVKGMSLTVPNGAKLFGPIDLEVKKGMSVLVSGPSGCGKSTMFRALTGLWPFGSGAIRVPQGARMMVVPQKPYMPMDSLLKAATYPSEPEAFTREQIVEAMRLSRLEHLIAKLDETENWAMVLSPGEQQRVAFVRVFLHKPDWLFLDEATSALDEETQKAMYDQIRTIVPGVTIVSIAHRASLRNYHDFIIDVVAPAPKLEPLAH